jgi:hypothetical protein
MVYKFVCGGRHRVEWHPDDQAKQHDRRGDLNPDYTAVIIGAAKAVSSAAVQASSKQGERSRARAGRTPNLDVGTNEAKSS